MMLRALNLLLCLTMVAFVATQYDDPDGPLWMLYYGVPAFWAGTMVWRPEWTRRSSGWRAALWASLAAMAALVAYYWPAMPGFWRNEVWMQEETAREGMGLMLAFVVLAVAVATVSFGRRR